MPRDVTVTLSHDLGKEGARQRIKEGSAKLQSQLGGGLAMRFTETWTSDDQLTFEAKGLGQHITGKIDIFPVHVRIEATLPILLASVAEIITGKLEKEGTLLLEKK